MSVVYKCDRCDALMDNLPRNVHYRIGYQWQWSSSVNLRDLCPECSKELEEWFLKIKKGIENEQENQKETNKNE